MTASERDPIGAAVFTAAHLAETSACRLCGNPDPARVGFSGCERCHSWPRCVYCRAWTDIVPSVSMVVDGQMVDVCDRCVERAS